MQRFVENRKCLFATPDQMTSGSEVVRNVDHLPW